VAVSRHSGDRLGRGGQRDARSPLRSLEGPHTLTNIIDAEATGPYAFWKTAGPARLAITDRGLTFATNGDRGVLILFENPVPGLEPLGILRHPELTVTVADVDGLADLLHTQGGRR
jgi:hypothetical protein